MSCPLKDKCLCNGKDNYLSCKILMDWFAKAQEASVRSHASKLVENDITIRRKKFYASH